MRGIHGYIYTGWNPYWDNRWNGLIFQSYFGWRYPESSSLPHKLLWVNDILPCLTIMPECKNGGPVLKYLLKGYGE